MCIHICKHSTADRKKRERRRARAIPNLRTLPVSPARKGNLRDEFWNLSIRLSRSAALDLKAGQNQNVIAVGILGSDIYDKMLVLRRFARVPFAIFFTTDFDALYLEREKERFTRNLVVASAEGLDANKRPRTIRDGSSLRCATVTKRSS